MNDADIRNFVAAFAPYCHRVADALEQITQRIRELRRENLRKTEYEIDYRRDLNGILSELENLAGNAAAPARLVDYLVRQGDTQKLQGLAAALRRAAGEGGSDGC